MGMGGEVRDVDEDVGGFDGAMEIIEVDCGC